MRGVAGAVLAAGSGRRMGAPKATLAVDGARLVDRAVGVLCAAGCDPVIAVVRDGVDVADATTVVNPAPERGMRSSLELAVDAAAEADAVAVLLADMPGVGAEAVRATVAAWRPGRVAVATYGGRRAHPTVMSPALWRDALADAGPDEGARRLLAARPDLVDEVPVAGDPADLDTTEDVRQWQARSASTRLVALVQGRVQGVGFRYWTRDRARELGLDGSATNLRDGRVRIVAQGPRAACQRLLDELTGPDAPGRVSDIVPTWGAAESGPGGFRVG